MISLIIPTYKEAKNIEELLKSLKNLKEIDEIIVVDDNSPDGTADIANKYAKIIVRKNERGLASAVIRGFDEAKGDIIGIMDGDLSHPVDKIPELLEKLKE